MSTQRKTNIFNITITNSNIKPTLKHQQSNSKPKTQQLTNIQATNNQATTKATINHANNNTNTNNREANQNKQETTKPSNNQSKQPNQAIYSKNQNHTI